jgi:hypothetical protein
VRKPKPEPMPREVWVTREPGPMGFLTWDIDPLLPRGERATRYVRADLLDSLHPDMQAVLLRGT